MKSDPVELLRAYDQQLRGAVELASALWVKRDGPLHIGAFDGGWGFVSYTDLAGYTEPSDGAALDRLIARAVDLLISDESVSTFEWKTRGHDLPLDLHQRLEAHGLVAEEIETVMAGEAAALTEAPPLPVGVALRRIGFDAAGRPQAINEVTADVRSTQSMLAEAFGQPDRRSAEAFADDILRKAETMQLWIAEADGQVICAGRLEIVPGTDFAGLWGGATRAEWRGRGIYRALTAARAKAAVAAGVPYLQVDCSAMSRPILERSGLVAITTSTPFRWHRTA